MAKVKNPNVEKNENIIFTEKKNTKDGFTHYARKRKVDLRKNKSVKTKRASA